MRILASGIDTLYLFSRGPVLRTEVRKLETAQQQAREAADRQAPGPILDISGHAFTMQRHGARTAPFLLDGEHATLLVNPDAGSTFPTFTVELRALFLWQKGAAAAATEAERMATHLLMRATQEDSWLHASRVDFAVDFQGWEPREVDGPSFVTRAHDRASHVQRKVFTGFMFGRGDVAGRLYCKSIEIERSHKGWFREIWAKCPVYDPALPVWRLEFQLRRPAIVGMDVGDGQGPLDTWQDVFSRAGGIWRYLTRNWLALKHRTKDSRQNFHPAWESLAAGGFRDGPWEGTDADLYRVHREDSAERMTGQIAGYLTRGLAEYAFHESAEGIVHPTLDDALPEIVRRVRAHTQRRGRTVEERARERVNAWLATAESLAMDDSLRVREPGEDDGEDDDAEEAA